MNQVINELITSADIETGTLRLRPQACDVRILLQEFEHGVVPLLNDRSIEFVGSIHKNTPNAFVDPERLIQVLSSLVADAIRKSPPYSVIVVSVQGADGLIQFRVKGPARLDTEIETQPASKRDYGRGDPGFRVCKALVEAHQGRMWIGKNARECTTVFFTVPQAGALLKSIAQNRTY
jgi:signal transduction histidine kinase